MINKWITSHSPHKITMHASFSIKLLNFKKRKKNKKEALAYQSMWINFKNMIQEARHQDHIGCDFIYMKCPEQANSQRPKGMGEGEVCVRLCSGERRRSLDWTELFSVHFMNALNASE